MPGPPPKKNARRRNARPEWRQLPAAGRCGPPPAWPLGGRSSKGLDALWEDLWSSPQAVAWEELAWTRLVARYARLLLAAERSDATAALLGEVRQLEDRLGLSPMAMKRLQWETTDQAAEAADIGTGASVARMDEYRARIG
jgi:hypothetical protein